MSLSEANISSEQFKVGQTVWDKEKGRKWIVVHQYCGTVWVYEASRTWNYWLPQIVSLTAIDPNQPAEPVPQACPFCGSRGGVKEGCEIFLCGCRNEDCSHDGPWKPTRLEAIQAWNQIRVEGLADLVAATVRRMSEPDAPEPTPKPCPCCGVGAETWNSGRSGKETEFVRCKSPGCLFSGPCKYTIRDAILAWNDLGNVAEEREACAKIAEEVDSHMSNPWHIREAIVAAIRKRGQQF